VQPSLEGSSQRQTRYSVSAQCFTTSPSRVARFSAVGLRPWKSTFGLLKSHFVLWKSGCAPGRRTSCLGAWLRRWSAHNPCRHLPLVGRILIKWHYAFVKPTDPSDEAIDNRVRPARFEDLVVWKESRSLVQRIYDITRQPKFASDRALSSQIQRSAVSVMANIAEGFARQGSGEWLHALSISIGSCAETKSHLYVALDCGYISEEQMKEIYAELDRIGRMLFKLRASASASRSNPLRPPKT